MSADVFFDDFFGAPKTDCGLTPEQAAQLDAIAALAARLPESRTSKLDRDLVAVGMLPSNFDQLQIDDQGRVSTTGGSGSSSSAAVAIVISVQDQDLLPVKYARVSIAGTNESAMTDVFGQATLYVDAGSYELRCQTPLGYETPLPQVLTVADLDLAITFLVNRTAPPAIAPVGMCWVTLRVVDQAGNPVTDAHVDHKLVEGSVVIEDQWHVNMSTPGVTDSSGAVTLMSVRGQVYDYTVTTSTCNRVTIRRQTPGAATATLSMMVEVSI